MLFSRTQSLGLVGLSGNLALNTSEGGRLIDRRKTAKFESEVVEATDMVQQSTIGKPLLLLHRSFTLLLSAWDISRVSN